MKEKTQSLAYIKRQAKKLKKEQGITHTAALELIAAQHGYSNWKHCQRSLTQNSTVALAPVVDQIDISFTDWLKKHKNRDSPLGDLAEDMLSDKTWPLYETLQEYLNYLYHKNAYSGAIAALKTSWKSYMAYLKRKKNSRASPETKNQNADTRVVPKIVFVKDVKLIPYNERTVEGFNPGDSAWISRDGRKAIPVTILEVSDRHYTFKVERPLKKAGDEHFLFKDEVRSTPELACMNRVTS